MSDLLRRLALFAVVAVAFWQVARAFLITGLTLLRNRPARIGNWFREAGPTHSETYADSRRYEVERERALEEGWVIASERRSPAGSITVDYRRVAPPFGVPSSNEG